jgi:hypothetical protein
MQEVDCLGPAGVTNGERRYYFSSESGVRKWHLGPSALSGVYANAPNLAKPFVIFSGERQVPGSELNTRA